MNSRLTVKWMTCDIPGPIPLEAEHKYSPPSVGLTLLILSVPFSKIPWLAPEPLINWYWEEGNELVDSEESDLNWTNFFQVMTGIGTPWTMQFMMAEDPSTASVSDGSINHLGGSVLEKAKKLLQLQNPRESESHESHLKQQEHIASRSQCHVMIFLERTRSDSLKSNTCPREMTECPTLVFLITINVCPVQMLTSSLIVSKAICPHSVSVYTKGRTEIGFNEKRARERERKPSWS